MSDERRLPVPLRASADAVTAPLLFLPRLAVGALLDIRAIARSTAELPQVRRQLADIEDQVGLLNEEVHRMRKGVDAVNDEVIGLRGDVDPIAGAASRLGRFGRRRQPPATPS